MLHEWSDGEKITFAGCWEGLCEAGGMWTLVSTGNDMGVGGSTRVQTGSGRSHSAGAHSGYSGR